MPYDLQHGHCLDLLEEVPADSLNVVITSPPFFGESYEAKIVDGWGRLGHETSAEAYVAHVVEILDALRPKMKRNGMVWMLIRDAPGEGGTLQNIPGQIGMQAQLAWAYTMYWVLDSIYAPKGYVPFGPLPATVPILGFCVDPEYHYWQDGAVIPDYLAASPPDAKGDVFQSIPPDVVSDLLDACCPTGGTVLDPMCGSGTVPAVANARGCYGIGMDISELAIKTSRRKVIRVKEMVRNEIATRQQQTGSMPPPSGN